jgi:hypothetical protein
MDVSEKRSAAEFGANVIARSDDRATTERLVNSDDPLKSSPPHPYIRRRIPLASPSALSPSSTLSSPSALSSHSVAVIRCRRAVVAAGDYVRFRSLRFAPTHIHRPYSADVHILEFQPR